MALADPQPPRARRSLLDRLYGWRTALIGSRGFQKRAARWPIASRLARRDGEALFDLVAGFVHSQVLQAFVSLDLSGHLAQCPLDLDELARRTESPPDRLRVLLQAACALGLLEQRRDGRYGLGRLGAALPGVPGLQQMICHHEVLYRDLADPVAFFRDGAETDLAQFWPYVFGATGKVDPEVAATYSELMADSQTLVAEEALAHLDFSEVRTLLDVGGGTGVFLTAVGQAYPDLRLHLFDLPQVIPPAQARFAREGLAERAHSFGGSFRADPLPEGADAISLVRVLYDHKDDTVKALLSKAYHTLPPGGRLFVVEPLSGGRHPSRAGDAYFGIYCLAMQTGRARSADEIASLLGEAGFTQIKRHKTARPFVTGLVSAQKA